jgi:hypothetical protein
VPHVRKDSDSTYFVEFSKPRKAVTTYRIVLPKQEIKGDFGKLNVGVVSTPPELIGKVVEVAIIVRSDDLLKGKLRSEYS